MSLNFGLPYMGSKSKIARDLIRLIPGGKRFVDVFAGGCAMTHAALLAKRWDTVLANDITDTQQFFVDTLAGKYRNEDRWISREDFFRLKDSDPFVRFCFSFGNNGEHYIYNQEIEPYKRACHYVVFFDQWDEFRRLCPEVTGAARFALNGITDRQKRRLAFGPAIVKALRKLPHAVIEANPLYRSCHKSHIVKILFNLSHVLRQWNNNLQMFLTDTQATTDSLELIGAS